MQVMNIGNSDWDSFQTHHQDYNKTIWELTGNFEETYISLIKAIRTLSYPKYSTSHVESSRYVYSPQIAAAGIPIFIMRPFLGQLEQATRSVVDRLRKEGDKAVFWLDTSGWLNTEVQFDGQVEDQDFFLDGIYQPSHGELRTLTIPRWCSIKTMEADGEGQPTSRHPPPHACVQVSCSRNGQMCLSSS